jgi:hypothetical protein
VFPSGSNAGDVIYVFALSSFNPMDALAKSQNGADIVDKPGFIRNLGIPAVIRSYLAGLTLSTTVHPRSSRSAPASRPTARTHT